MLLTLSLSHPWQVAATTALGTFLAALAWPAALVSSAALIDNSWSMAINRAERAGEALAEVLMQRVQGNRPVTLAGYSMGARVIFYALEVLPGTGAVWQG